MNIKKYVIALISLISSFCAFAQQPSPELLKQKELFENIQLFESPLIYADRAANAALLKDYEANPSAYQPKQLIPIANCYLIFGDAPKARAAMETFLKAVPNDVRTQMTLGTLYLLAKETDKAIELFKSGMKSGNDKAVVLLCSAYLMANNKDAIKPYFDDLKKQTKTNLEALNIAIIYALGDGKNPDEALIKSVLSEINPREVMKSATPDSFASILRLYLADRKVWPAKALVVPARAAALVEAWPIAMAAYKEALKENPKDSLALRGMGLVAYRTGDIMGASDYIMKSYNAGDKEASLDGVELFLLSNNKAIWNKFLPIIKDAKLIPQVKAGLVQYAVRNENESEMFFIALSGDNTDILYKDTAVRSLIKDGLQKYGTDSRAVEVKNKFDTIKPASGN